MSYDLKKIKVLGYSTDFNQCECCGKQNLKGTVNILDLDSGVTLHFGSTCAVKADKYDTLEAFNKAKKEISSKIRNHQDLRKWAGRMIFKYKIDSKKFEEIANDYCNFCYKNVERVRYDWKKWGN